MYKHRRHATNETRTLNPLIPTSRHNKIVWCGYFGYGAFHKVSVSRGK
nr:MAG TPA_asm: hypothetical protein [Caudoviricetes sp.]